MTGEAVPPAGPEPGGLGAPQLTGPQVGADEWVARREQRHEYLPSWLGWAQRSFERVGWWPRLAVVTVAGLALPLLGLGGSSSRSASTRWGSPCWPSAST